jgi:hypothetical protein
MKECSLQSTLAVAVRVVVTLTIDVTLPLPKIPGYVI